LRKKYVGVNRDVYIPIGIPRVRLRNNIKVGVTVADSGEILFNLVQTWAFVDIVCIKCVLKYVYMRNFGFMQLVNSN
jgi:hypothetical protein